MLIVLREIQIKFLIFLFISHTSHSSLFLPSSHYSLLSPPALLPHPVLIKGKASWEVNMIRMNRAKNKNKQKIKYVPQTIKFSSILCETVF